MSYPTTVAEEGIKIIRHHDKAYEVPTRLMRWGGVLKDIDQLGRYIFDEDLGMADECCNLVWQKQTRETSGFANAWPAKLAAGSARGTVATPGGGGGGGTGAPRAGATFTDPPSGVDANQATYGFRPSGNTQGQPLGPTNPAAGPVFTDPVQPPDANSPAHGGFGRPTTGDGSTSSTGGSSVGGQDPNMPGGPPVATPARKNNCGSMSAKHTMLPVYDDTWVEDKRFKALDVKFPDKYPKVPKGLYGIALSGTYEYEQTPLFFPTDPRLFAVNYAGDAKMGTLVCDLNSDFEVDPERTAPLQSTFRVIKKPLGGANAIAIQLGPSGCGDAEGGFVYDVGSAGKGGGNSPVPTGGPTGPGMGVASGGGGVEVGGGGQDSNPAIGGGDGGVDAGADNGNFVIALLSVNKGGPIDVGSEDDQHHVGADGDKTKINKAHISTKALFRKNWTKDGPLRFEETYHEGSDLAQYVKVHLAWSGSDWAWWTTGPLQTVDPRFPNIREDPHWPFKPTDPVFDHPNVSTGNIGGGGGGGGNGPRIGGDNRVITVDGPGSMIRDTIRGGDSSGANVASPAGTGPNGGPTTPAVPDAPTTTTPTGGKSSDGRPLSPDGTDPTLPWSPSIEDLLKGNKNLSGSSGGGTGFNGFPTNVAFGQSFQGSNIPLAAAMTLAQAGSWGASAMSAGKPQTTNPIAGAMSSFGAQGGQTNPAGCGGGPATAGAAGDPWVYTDVPGNSRYGPGTTSGGWIVHPPETTPADQESYGMVPPNKTLSTTYFMTAPGAYFASGTPQMAIGGVTSGWSWGMDTATGDLVWRTHVQGVPTTGMRFILASQNFAWYSGTSYEGIFEHANTGNRTYTVPDLTASVELFQVTSSSPNGSLTGIIGTLAWDNVNHQLYVNTDNATAWSLAGGATGSAGPPGPAGSTVPVIVSGTTTAGYGLEAHGKTVADGSAFYPGSLAPVAGTDIGFTLLVPGSVAMAYTLTWNSASDTFPVLTSGLYVDGTFYYLGISYEVQGSGSDTTLGFAHTGTLTLSLAAGNHTVQIGASGDGRMYIANSAASPTTISVLVPTPLSVNIPAQTLPDSITTMVAGQFIVMDDWLPTPMSRRLMVDTNTLTLVDGGPGNFILLGMRALADGQVFIGSGGTANVASTLTAGSNVTITNGPGTITISATGGGGSITGGGAAGQVTYWTTATNIAGDAGLTYDATNDLLTVMGAGGGPQLTLAADVSNYSTFTVSAGGNLTIDSSGGFLTIPDHVDFMGVAGGGFGGESVAISPTALAAGSKWAFSLNGALNTGGTIGLANFVSQASTGQTASTELQFVRFNLGATTTWATGNFAMERAVTFLAPTIAFAAASTVTTAATVYIDNAPQVGANATLTNSYALWVAAGTTLLTTLTLTNALDYPYGGTGLAVLGTALQVLRTNAGATAMEWATVSSGSSLPASDSTGYKFLRDDSVWADPGFGSVLTVDEASSFPLGRKLLLDTNYFSAVDMGPGSYFYVTSTLGSGTAGQVAYWSSTYGHSGSAGLVFDDVNISLGIGPAVAVVSTETFRVQVAETIASATSATWNAVNFTGPTVNGVTNATCVLTGNTSITTANGFNFLSVSSPSISAANAITITTACTVYVDGAPSSSGNITFTNSYGLWVNAGSRMTGISNSSGLASLPSYSFSSATTSGMYLNGGTSSVGFAAAGLSVVIWAASSVGTTCAITQTTGGTSGVRQLLTVTGAALTGQTAGSEVIDVDFALNRTLQHASNTAVATQRAFVIRPPTYSFASATGTITTAATFTVTGPPVAGTNAVITNNPYALLVQAGDVCLAGSGSALATTAITGHTWIPNCAGTPTGAAVGLAGSTPIIVDTTALKIWCLIAGTWRFAQLT